jgi:hypothetical protein
MPNATVGERIQAGLARYWALSWWGRHVPFGEGPKLRHEIHQIIQQEVPPHEEVRRPLEEFLAKMVELTEAHYFEAHKLDAKAIVRRLEDHRYRIGNNLEWKLERENKVVLWRGKMRTYRRRLFLAHGYFTREFFHLTDFRDVQMVSRAHVAASEEYIRVMKAMSWAFSHSWISSREDSVKSEKQMADDQAKARAQAALEKEAAESKVKAQAAFKRSVIDAQAEAYAEGQARTTLEKKAAAARLKTQAAFRKAVVDAKIQADAEDKARTAFRKRVAKANSRAALQKRAADAKVKPRTPFEMRVAETHAKPRTSSEKNAVEAKAKVQATFEMGPAESKAKAQALFEKSVTDAQGEALAEAQARSTLEKEAADARAKPRTSFEKRVADAHDQADAEAKRRAALENGAADGIARPRTFFEKEIADARTQAVFEKRVLDAQAAAHRVMVEQLQQSKKKSVLLSLLMLEKNTERLTPFNVVEDVDLKPEPRIPLSPNLQFLEPLAGGSGSYLWTLVHDKKIPTGKRKWQKWQDMQNELQSDLIERKKSSVDEFAKSLNSIRLFGLWKISSPFVLNFVRRWVVQWFAGLWIDAMLREYCKAWIPSGENDWISLGGKELGGKGDFEIASPKAENAARLFLEKRYRKSFVARFCDFTAPTTSEIWEAIIEPTARQGRSSTEELRPPAKPQLSRPFQEYIIDEHLRHVEVHARAIAVQFVGLLSKALPRGAVDTMFRSLGRRLAKVTEKLAKQYAKDVYFIFWMDNPGARKPGRDSVALEILETHALAWMKGARKIYADKFFWDRKRIPREMVEERLSSTRREVLTELENMYGDEKIAMGLLLSRLDSYRSKVKAVRVVKVNGATDKPAVNGSGKPFAVKAATASGKPNGHYIGTPENMKEAPPSSVISKSRKGDGPTRRISNLPGMIPNTDEAKQFHLQYAKWKALPWWDRLFTITESAQEIQLKMSNILQHDVPAAKEEMEPFEKLISRMLSVTELAYFNGASLTVKKMVEGLHDNLGKDPEIFAQEYADSHSSVFFFGKDRPNNRLLLMIANKILYDRALQWIEAMLTDFSTKWIDMRPDKNDPQLFEERAKQSAEAARNRVLVDHGASNVKNRRFGLLGMISVPESWHQWPVHKGDDPGPLAMVKDTEAGRLFDAERENFENSGWKSWFTWGRTAGYSKEMVRIVRDLVPAEPVEMAPFANFAVDLVNVAQYYFSDPDQISSAHGLADNLMQHLADYADSYTRDFAQLHTEVYWHDAWWSNSLKVRQARSILQERAMGWMIAMAEEFARAWVVTGTVLRKEIEEEPELFYEIISTESQNAALAIYKKLHGDSNVLELKKSGLLGFNGGVKPGHRSKALDSAS